MVLFKPELFAEFPDLFIHLGVRQLYIFILQRKQFNITGIIFFYHFYASDALFISSSKYFGSMGLSAFTG